MSSSARETSCHAVERLLFKKPHKCCVCNGSVWLKQACGKCRTCHLRLHLKCQSGLKVKCVPADNNADKKKPQPLRTSAPASVPSIVIRTASDPDMPIANKNRFYATEVIETHKVIETESPDEEMIVNQYKVISSIGKGAFGTVYLVTDMNNGLDYAMKVMSKSHLEKKRYGMGPGDMHTAMDDIKKEIAILKRLKHPNVIHLIEVLDDPDQDCLYMVFELADDVILKMENGKAEKVLTEDEARTYFRQLICGMEYLHSLLIVHRDLKPDNLLLKNGVVKICDFGVSEEFVSPQNDKITSSVGSAAFFAPEMCLPEDEGFSGKPVDIWAMGVTLYCMLVGELPFQSNSPMELCEKICESDVAYPDHLSPECIELFEKIFCRDPTKRIKLDGLKEDPWITESGAQAWREKNQLPKRTPSGRVDVSDEEIFTSIVRVESDTSRKSLTKDKSKKSVKNERRKSLKGKGSPQKDISKKSVVLTTTSVSSPDIVVHQASKPETIASPAETETANETTEAEPTITEEPTSGEKNEGAAIKATVSDTTVTSDRSS